MDNVDNNSHFDLHSQYGLKKTDSVDWLYGGKEKKMDLVVVFNALRRPLTSKV